MGGGIARNPRPHGRGCIITPLAGAFQKNTKILPENMSTHLLGRSFEAAAHFLAVSERAKQEDLINTSTVNQKKKGQQRTAP
jgi:hypothetical protein